MAILKVPLSFRRVFGVFEQLDSKIKHYLSAQTPPYLFELSFARLESDFESGSNKGLVGNMLALLWVSRKGLSETELTEMLGVAAAVWAPLFIALSEAIVSKSGYLAFFHDYMRQAVESRSILSFILGFLSSKRRPFCRYLKRTNSYVAYNNKLIQYFASYPDVQRRMEEVSQPPFSFFIAFVLVTTSLVGAVSDGEELAVDAARSVHRQGEQLQAPLHQRAQVRPLPLLALRCLQWRCPWYRYLFTFLLIEYNVCYFV